MVLYFLLFKYACKRLHIFFTLHTYIEHERLDQECDFL